jgi:oligopeptide transport system substrate-binding protein
MYLRKFSVAAVALGLVLAACTPGASQTASTSGAASASQPEEVEQVLHLNMSQEPQFLDPQQATDSISIQVLRSISHPLVYYNEGLELVPGLADSWEVSPDGQTITFHLGAHKYSDGSDIVADDFVTGFRRLGDPRVASGYSYVLDPVVGFADLQGADPDSDEAVEAALENFGVEAPDPQTFVVHLARPAAYFAYIAALWLTAPVRDDFVFTEAEGYVSSGPMMMEEWNHQSNIVLVPNPNWNGDEVAIDRIELAMINDPAASLAAYDNDELDVTGVPSADVARIRDDPQYADQILEGDRLAVSYYGFDLKNPDGPFTNSVLLRKAFNEALDKEVLVQTVFGGVGTVAHSLVPPGMPGHQDDEFIPFDTDQAKADFDQALNDLGITADDLQLQLGYNVAGSNEDQAVFFQEQWRSTFGIEVELVATEDFGSYLDILNDDPYDIFRLGWGADYPHPNNFLTDLISCTSTNNNMGYCNEEVDQLLEQAAAEPTLETQVPLYNQAQEMVMADAPIIPQLFSQAFTLVKPWVQGFTPTAQDSNSGELFYYKTSIAAH